VVNAERVGQMAKEAKVKLAPRLVVTPSFGNLTLRLLKEDVEKDLRERLIIEAVPDGGPEEEKGLVGREVILNSNGAPYKSVKDGSILFIVVPISDVIAYVDDLGRDE